MMAATTRCRGKSYGIRDHTSAGFGIPYPGKDRNPQRLALRQSLAILLFEMSTATEISAAIRLLPTGERWNLLREFADELWSNWDIQIESDLNSGRLDEFISQARADISASKIRPLDEVLCNA